MNEKDLYKAILELKDIEECNNFFNDLCTPKEINDMRDRWLIANLLFENNLSYRDIHNKTGISLATITRVARFLKQESNKGYKLILERIKNR